MQAGLADANSSNRVSESATLNSVLSDYSSNPAPASSDTSTRVDAPQAQPEAVLQESSASPVRTLSVRTIADGTSRVAKIALAPNARVGDVLRAAGIKLQPLDRVQPAATTVAYNHMTVRVTRIRAALKTRRVTIAPETLYRPTADIASGAKQRIQAGLPGTRTVVERVWTKDGKVTLREAVSNQLTIAPRPSIFALGTRAAYVPSRIPYHKRYARAYSLQSRAGLASRAGSPRDRFAGASSNYGSNAAVGTAGTLRAVRSITLVATGYSPDPRENGGYTVTATGLPIGYGAAAVDPRVIPLGTKMYVEGYGYAFACDVGGAIKGNRIDLAYNSYYEANTKGRKKVRVWILQ
jgi:3D (Asp-Asp-Asp) domain-containing protein